MSGRTDWKAIVARVQAKPAPLRLSNVPVQLARTIRDRRARDLRVPGGRVAVDVEHEHTAPDGIRRADLYLTWVPDVSVSATLGQPETDKE